jgi:hypothetical protein
VIRDRVDVELVADGGLVANLDCVDLLGLERIDFGDRVAVGVANDEAGAVAESGS